MFSDGEGLQTEVKFAVAATYDKFAATWGVTSEKLRWVDDWSTFLSGFSVAEINAVADYCVSEFRRPPVPMEYIELCTRVRNGKTLSEPIVSKLERLAYLILTQEDFKAGNTSSSEISDACLIAAAIASLNARAELLPNMSTDYVIEELTGRARMFFEEALRWQLDASEGKGYWASVLHGSRKVD